jgi:hypothetical protein
MLASVCSSIARCCCVGETNEKRAGGSATDSPRDACLRNSGRYETFEKKSEEHGGRDSLPSFVEINDNIKQDIHKNEQIETRSETIPITFTKFRLQIHTVARLNKIRSDNNFPRSVA